MAYFSQPSSPVANFNKCVIALLVRVPSTSTTPDAGSFLEFGNSTSGPSSLFFNAGSFGALMYSAEASYSASANGIPGDLDVASLSIGMNPVAATDTWHRVIISIDVSGSATFGWVGPGAFDYTVVANTFRTWISVGDTDYSPTTFLDPGATSHVGDAGSFLPSMSISPESGANVDVVYPAFTIQILGTEWSIPVLGANAAPDYNGKFEIAEFIMWTGVSLDTSITANRRYFITAAGNPVSPDAADGSIIALGTPKYDFRGNQTAFLTNRGSAGNPTKTGTIADFTPGP